MCVLFKLITLWILVKLVQASKFEYKLIPLTASWKGAQDICLKLDYLLLPDLGGVLLSSGVLDNIGTEETVWMNAKHVEIVYTGSSAYLKFTYQPADSKLTAYLCHNVMSRETKRNVSSEPLSWKQAQTLCDSATWTLFNVSTPKQAKSTMSLLKKDVTFWVDKMANYKIPRMASGTLGMREECIGVRKLADGSLSYSTDNCAHKRRFICVNSYEKFAPTITRLSEPLPATVGEPFLDVDGYTTSSTVGTVQNVLASSGNVDAFMSGGTLGSIIAGSVGGLVLILVILAAVYFRRRLKNRQDYRRSLQRYTNRQTSARHLLTNKMNSNCSNNFDIINTSNLEGYEDCDKREYEQCQKDVVQECSRTFWTRYTKDHLSDGSNSALAKLPDYHAMDGNNVLQVLPAYESYDPDLGHLQQVHGYINKDNQPQLSDLEQYDNIPKLPEKTKKSTALDDLEQYENQDVGNKRIVDKAAGSKPPVGTDRDKGSCLDDLEQYENYQVPKREKGIFRLFKTEKVNQASKAKKDTSSNIESQVDKLNDLDDYENYESPITIRKGIKQLDDLDAYENYAVNN